MAHTTRYKFVLEGAVTIDDAMAVGLASTGGAVPDSEEGAAMLLRLQMDMRLALPMLLSKALMDGLAQHADVVHFESAGGNVAVVPHGVDINTVDVPQGIVESYDADPDGPPRG